MQVSEIMTTDLQVSRPEDTLSSAAKIMRELDCGAVPVVDGRKELVGILTDRDICLCAAERDEALTALQVSDAVTWKPITCLPEETIESAKFKLAQHQIRRLPVIDSAGNLVGILSVGDIARARANSHYTPTQEDQLSVAATFAAISRPTPASQTHP